MCLIDMKKPEYCGECRFFVDLDSSDGRGGSYCAAAMKYHDGSAADRKKICPLKENSEEET